MTTGFNFFRHSCGLKYPEKVSMTNEEADLFIRSEEELIYRSDTDILNDDGNVNKYSN